MFIESKRLATLYSLPVNMGAKAVEIVLPTGKSAKILKWKVKEGTVVSVGRVILLYDINPNNGKEELIKFKANQVGTVRKLLAKEGEIVHPGYVTCVGYMRITSFRDFGV
jgi:pyruvate/2-oxoglutarate dehydrogenase complex dihydrolipoamide acyltransferase (E2) component